LRIACGFPKFDLRRVKRRCRALAAQRQFIHTIFGIAA
jgi:hypothetical protein